MGAKKLPRSCFFSSAGPNCNNLWDLLDDAGFGNVQGSNEAAPTGQLWLTPPGGQKTLISPPGRNPDQTYDVTSQIELGAVMHAP